MTNKQLEKYKKLGWEFKSDRWVSPHNGDIEDELHVKSPRLYGFFCVAGARHSVPDWDDVDEKEMVDMEKARFALQKWDEIDDDIQDLVMAALKEGKGKITINLKKYDE